MTNASSYNAEFHAQLAAGQENLLHLRSSWIEQRNFGIDFPMSALPEGHPVKSELVSEFERMRATLPNLDGFSKLDNVTSQIASLGGWACLAFGEDGSLVELRQEVKGGRSWASASSPLALFRYRTFVETDFESWRLDYLINGTGGENEYGMQSSFMKANPTPTHRFEPPVLEEVWVKASEGEVLAKMGFAKDLCELYGAPESVWLRVAADVLGDEVAGATSTNRITMTLSIFNKTATRLPEAAFVTFQPDGSASAEWEHSKLGSWASPLDVADGAAHGLHYVDENGVRAQMEGGSRIQILSPDVGLLRYDEPLPFPTPIHDDVDLSKGISFALWNNIWHTNYPAWLPFADKARNLQWRFELVFS